MRTSGQRVRATGQAVRPSGQCVRTSGQAVRARGQAGWASGQRGWTGGQGVRTGGPGVRASGQRVRTSSQRSRARRQALRTRLACPQTAGQCLTVRTVGPPCPTDREVIGSHCEEAADRRAGMGQARTPAPRQIAGCYRSGAKSSVRSSSSGWDAPSGSQVTVREWATGRWSPGCQTSTTCWSGSTIQ